MNITIAGAGTMGRDIAGQLCRKGHDVTIIDKNNEVLNNAVRSMDVIGYCGNCISPQVLKESEIHAAKVFIAATGSDETNLISCLLAEKAGAEHTIALLRDPDYSPDTNIWKESLGLSLAIHPDYVTAEEIYRVLQFPAASHLEIFPDSQLELLTFRIPPNSKLDNVALRDLTKIAGQRVLICTIEREGTYMIPDGTSVLKSGDMVALTGEPDNLHHFFLSAGLYKKPVQNVLILGGSRSAVYLYQLLENTGVKVTIIENNPDRCEYLSERLRKADIICADGTAISVLQENGIRTADSFIAMTGSDENNIILSLYAQNSGVSKIVTKVKNDKFSKLLKDVLPESSLSPLRLVTQRVEGYVRGLEHASGKSRIEALYYLGNQKVTATQYLVGSKNKCIGRSLAEMKLKHGVLLGSVTRGKEHIVPDGHTVLMPEDRVIIISTDPRIHELDDILA